MNLKFVGMGYFSLPTVSIPIRDLMNLKSNNPTFVKELSVSIPIRDLMNLKTRLKHV